MTELLRATGLSLRYANVSRPAVQDATLAIDAGEAVGLVGESGSGKTTLARALTGLLEPAAGTLSVEGRSWRAIKRGDPARRQIQMIFQDPYGALNPWLTPVAAVTEVLTHWKRVPRRDAARRAGEILGEVGLHGETITRLPRRLSGGQCQRVGIARALAADPQVLIADEPTSSLDVSVQAQILNLLSELRRRRNLTLVLISHDLAIVRFATERALVMYGGRIVEEGPTDALLRNPRHPYTQILIDSIPGREGTADMTRNNLGAHRGCVFAERCPLVGPECLLSQPPLRGGAHRNACVREHPDVHPATSIAEAPR